jgi:hypothetical protein
MNIALIIKWWWRMLSDPTNLWAICIKNIQKIDTNSIDKMGKKSMGGTWSSIANINEDVKDLG